jgi:hypothetical protein
MTERDFGSGKWIAEVVNVKDPDQSGRVQIRIFGRHDDKENIKDEDLHWAIPMQPVTSAAYGKIGMSPLGLVRGSKVYGEWFDSDNQLPIIFGSLGKAGDPKEGGDTTDGIPEIDTKKGSIPGPSQNYSDPVPINPYSNLFGSKIDINKINNEKTEDFKTIATYTPATGIVNNEKVDEKLKEPKKPTTASAKKDDTSDVLDIVKQVDPDKKSRVLPEAADGFKQVQNIMSMTSPGGITKLLSGGIQGAIGGLAKNLGLANVMGPLNQVLKQANLPPVVQNALRGALANVAKSAMSSGGKYNSNAISNTIPGINPRRGSPSTNLIVATVAATYIQQYFALDKEPYPGYIQWKDPTSGNLRYTLRGQEPHYSSAQAHVQGNSAAQMVKTLAPILTKLTQGGTLSTSDITKLATTLTKSMDGVAADGLSKVLGKGVDLKSIIGMASKLIPNIAGAIGKLTGGHLPKSVLDVGKVGESMNDFTKNQSLLAMKKKEMKKAIEPEPPAEQDAQIQAYNDYVAKGDMSISGEGGAFGAAADVAADNAAAAGAGAAAPMITNDTQNIIDNQQSIQGVGPLVTGSAFG